MPSETIASAEQHLYIEATRFTATSWKKQEFMFQPICGYDSDSDSRAKIAARHPLVVIIGAMPDPSQSESSTSRRNRDHRSSAGPLSWVALILAVAALALAGWTFYKSEYSSTPTYSDTQRAEAKVKACGAADLVRRGVSLNTNLQPAGGPEDVTGSLAVAANARVALPNGGQYLLSQLDPATPTDLADAVRNFANNLTDIGAAATAGAQNADPEQAARLRDADTANATVVELCK
jgi:hypothetical protein